jgi:DNA modification methylase
MQIWIHFLAGETTAIAAAKLKRRFIGIDISADATTTILIESTKTKLRYL